MWIPLWQVVALVLSAGVVGFVLGRMKARRMMDELAQEMGLTPRKVLDELVESGAVAVVETKVSEEISKICLVCGERPCCVNCESCCGVEQCSEACGAFIFERKMTLRQAEEQGELDG